MRCVSQYEELPHYGMDGIPPTMYGDPHGARALQAVHLGHGPQYHQYAVPPGVGSGANDAVNRDKDSIYGYVDFIAGIKCDAIRSINEH